MTTPLNTTVAVDDIRDIHGPILVLRHHPWWPFAIVGVGIVVLAIIVRAVVLYRRRRILPNDVRAMRALAAARELIEQGDVQGFSTRVSSVVRVYVESSFGVHAPKLTTEELLANLMTDNGPVSSHRGELGVFLEFCDLAKYARWSLSRSEMAGMLDSAEAFVRATSGGYS